MKFPVALVLILGLVAAEEECYTSIHKACDGLKKDVACNSLLGGFNTAQVQTNITSYVNEQLASSYDYLLLGTYFNTYQKNRPGFVKLFQGLSEKAWDKSIELIKHITKRGGRVTFQRPVNNRINTFELNEVQALSKALDNEKKLALEAHQIHHKVSHTDRHEKHYDPEISQFIEEEFLEYQADCIRKLSGYANDLSRLIKFDKPSLNIYLFDEYLQKQ